jgi:hypothetical protein
MNILLFLLCCLGVSYAWSDTKASVPFRNLVARVPYIREALLCHECSSFWISLLITIVFNPIAEYTPPFASNVLLAFCGFFVNMYFVRKNLIPNHYE